MPDEAFTAEPGHQAQWREWRKKKSSNSLEEPKPATEEKSAPTSAQHPVATSSGRVVPQTPKIKIPSALKDPARKETPSLVRPKSPVVKEEEVKKPLLEERSTPFDESQVIDAWKAFRKMRLEAGASDTEKLVLDRRLEKSGDTQVTLFMESQLEISILDKFEQDLIQHLRKSLDNTFVQIEKEVTEQESTRNLYTSKEKFEYMAQQNPVLRELKDRLGLDFEY